METIRYSTAQRQTVSPAPGNRGVAAASGGVGDLVVAVVPPRDDGAVGLKRQAVAAAPGNRGEAVAGGGIRDLAAPGSPPNENTPGQSDRGRYQILERETGIEPATLYMRSNGVKRTLQPNRDASGSPRRGSGSLYFGSMRKLPKETPMPIPSPIPLRLSETSPFVSTCAAADFPAPAWTSA